MRYNKRRIAGFSAITLTAIILMLIAVKLITARKISSLLPEYPELSSLSKPLREQITEAGKKAQKNPSAGNIGMLGLVYHSGTFYEQAEVCYNLASVRDNKETKWNYYLGYIARESGNSDKALENFRIVTGADSENLLALYYYGEALQNLGRLDEAAAIFRKIAAPVNQVVSSSGTIRKNIFPLKTYAGFQLARIYMNAGRPDSCEKVLNQIIRENINFGPAYRLLGNIYFEKGDGVMSRKLIDRANDLPVYTPPPDPLIDRLALMSRSEQYLLKQIDVSVQSLNPYYTIELLNNSLKYFPENKFLISKAVSLFLLIGNGRSALPYLDRHRYFFRDDYKELMDVADLLYDNGFRKEAMEYFNTAKASKKSEPDTQSQLAMWLFERGMRNESMALIDEQLKSSPENSDVIVDAAYIFLLDGNTREALPLIVRLDKTKPGDALTIKMKALLAEKSGDLSSAIQLYEKSFRANPEDMTTIKYLGMVLMREELWSKVIPFFRKALEYHPNEPYLLEALGRVFVTCPDRKFRNISEGKELSERAFYRFTSTPLTQVSAGINLSLAYAEMGERSQASSIINKTLSLARKANAKPDYLKYIEDLSRQFGISR